MLTTIIAAIKAAVSLRALIVYGGIAVAVLGGVSWWTAHWYNAGYNAAVHAIAKKDRKALEAVNEATSKVDDCAVRGGEWDSTRGVCK